MIELTKAERHEVYKLTKELYLKSTLLQEIGLCNYINDALYILHPELNWKYLDDRPELEDYDNLCPFINMEYYREFYDRYRQSNWQDDYDLRKPRIKCLDECIAETAPC